MNKILLKKSNKPTKSGLYMIALYGDILAGVNSAQVYIYDDGECWFDIINGPLQKPHRVSQWSNALWSDEITFEQ
jgi:hypothetical protein